jgi:2-iminobutanoate/2-iminopropanoate deaminase
MKSIINTKSAPAPIGPYNQAVHIGSQLFVSGQIAINPDSGELIVGSVKDEASQVMKNLKAIVDEAGFSMGDVVKCTIFLSDMSDFSAVNEIYGSYFDENAPSRETVAVRGLPKGVNVEISCIAVKES